MNSLVWLLRHMARTEDVFVNLILFDRPQLFDEDWRQRQNTDRLDIGTGMTSGEVSRLSDALDLKAAQEYRNAVGLSTRELIQKTQDETWQRRIQAEDLRRAAAAGAFGPNAGWLEGFFSQGGFGLGV